MSEAGQLCGERRVVLVEKKAEPRLFFCQKPSTGFCAGRAVISHIRKALTHNSSNNKADFFPSLAKALSGGGGGNAGGEFNPRVGICGCLDIYMALAMAVCLLRVTSCLRGL